MIQRKNTQGFTLLDQVVALSIASIGAATAANYLDEWVATSDQSASLYSQQVASSAMHTHRIWAQAERRSEPEWQDVIYLSGIDHELNQKGQLILHNQQGQGCRIIEPNGDTHSKTRC